MIASQNLAFAGFLPEADVKAIWGNGGIVCGTARPIGRVTLLASRELAQTLGLVPCTDCRPDLHPISR